MHKKQLDNGLYISVGAQNLNLTPKKSLEKKKANSVFISEFVFFICGGVGMFAFAHLLHYLQPLLYRLWSVFRCLYLRED